jgi:hypothetical protein
VNGIGALHNYIAMPTGTSNTAWCRCPPDRNDLEWVCYGRGLVGHMDSREGNHARQPGAGQRK